MMLVEYDNAYRARLLADGLGWPGQNQEANDLCRTALRDADGPSLDWLGSTLGLPRYGQHGFAWPRSTCEGVQADLPGPTETISCAFAPPCPEPEDHEEAMAPLRSLGEALHAPAIASYVVDYWTRFHPEARVTWDASLLHRGVLLNFTLWLGDFSCEMSFYQRYAPGMVKRRVIEAGEKLAWQFVRAEGLAHRERSR